MAGQSLAPSVVADLVRRYGTPLYVYRLDDFRAAVAALRDALPDEVDIFYSAKANPHPAVLAEAARLGLGLEISSVGELGGILCAQAPADRCLYSGPAKTPAELRSAVRAGVRLFSVESANDLARLVDAADTPVDYLVRLNDAGAAGAAGLRMTGTPSQFGVPTGEVHHDWGLLRQLGTARPVGLHVFSATNVTDEVGLLAELAANLATAVSAAQRARFTPRVVDIGGGFGAPFAVPGALPTYPTLRSRLADTLDEALPGWRAGEPRVMVESGRHLIATAGTLLTTVMDHKSSGGRDFVLCDAGVNSLGGMSGLGRLLPPGAQPGDQPADGSAVVLAGPLCTPLDVLSRRARMGEVRVGDVLSIPNVGAYGLTASLVAFLGRPLAAEVVLDGSTVVSARRLSLVEEEASA